VKTAGFTLIEIMVTLLIVGILSTIATPSWVAFSNRQRVNAANDAVLRALQEAQRQARSKKLSYSVSFLSAQNQVPKVAVYPEGTVLAATDPRWTALGEDIALQPGQVSLYSNIDAANPNQKVAETTLATSERRITFDYTGALTIGAVTPLKIVVAPPSAALTPTAVKRCVIVETLIGGMRTAKDDGCN